MIGQIEGLCAQLPFQCALMYIGVLFQNKFGYTVYSEEHCDRWCKLGVCSVGCASITVRQTRTPTYDIKALAW